MSNQPMRIRPTRKKATGDCGCGKRVKPGDPRRSKPQRTVKKRF